MKKSTIAIILVVLCALSAIFVLEYPKTRKYIKKIYRKIFVADNSTSTNHTKRSRGKEPEVRDFDVDKAVAELNRRARPKSKAMCAMYVRIALEAGGCDTRILLHAYQYMDFLPKINFKEVSKEGYKAQKGDIIVFPKIGSRKSGHIAMYNGKQWVSDFFQPGIIVHKDYRKADYRYYRFQK